MLTISTNFFAESFGSPCSSLAGVLFDEVAKDTDCCVSCSGVLKHGEWNFCNLFGIVIVCSISSVTQISFMEKFYLVELHVLLFINNCMMFFNRVERRQQTLHTHSLNRIDITNYNLSSFCRLLQIYCTCKTR